MICEGIEEALRRHPAPHRHRIEHGADYLIEDDDIELAYGAGAQFNLGALGLRAEYEKFDTDVIGDLDVISAGVTFTPPRS